MERLRRHISNEMVFEADGEEWVIHPKKGDRLKLGKLLADLNENDLKDTSIVMGAYASFLQFLFEREITTSGQEITSQDKECIEIFIENNLQTLFEQLLIKWKISTKEDIEKEKKKRMPKKESSNPDL
jgi:hypothetical protein